MSVSLSEAEKNVWGTIAEFHKQLNTSFESNQIVQDYALLNGFLTFIDSKLNRMIKESLDAQHSVYMQTKEGSSTLEGVTVDDKTIPLILRLYWEKICYPIFKWFRAWRKILLPKNSKEQPKFVEYRKMNAKLTKFFKSVHKFYYKVMEDILKRYDTSEVISKGLCEQLNLARLEGASESQTHLDPNNRFSVLIVVSIHSCLLYLGSTQRYKTVGEKISNKYTIQDFKKSFRYLDLACLVLPSIGETHLQKGLIYIQTNNLGSAIYEFTRSALARIPSPAGLTNFTTIICEKDSNLRQKFETFLEEINSQELDGTKIVNREIIEFYFVALFGSHFAPQNWLDVSNQNQLQNGMGLNHLQGVFFDKISTRYIKNIDAIFQNLLTVIGGFDLLLLKSNKDGNTSDTKSINLKNLQNTDLSYLKFAFDFITHVINNVIKESWNKNIEAYQLLAMVRIIECWLKSNRAVLQYSHRDEKFCKALALLLNDMIKSKKIDITTISTHRPKRSYFFKEDVDLKEFASLKFALTDFNDDEIFARNDKADRLVGVPPEEEKLDASDEALLRLQAILASGIKFLAKNSCGIKWNAQNMLYEILIKPKKQYPMMVADTSSKLTSTIGTRNFSDESITSKNDKKKLTSKQEKVISIAELEEQLRRTRHGDITSQWGYSGSSAPMAPSTFAVKPSSDLTNKIKQHLGNPGLSDVSTVVIDSSTSSSPYSPATEEKHEVHVTSKKTLDIEVLEAENRTGEEGLKLSNKFFMPDSNAQVTSHEASSCIPTSTTSMPAAAFSYSLASPTPGATEQFGQPFVHPPPGMPPLRSPHMQQSDMRSFLPVQQLYNHQEQIHAYPSNSWMGSYLQQNQYLGQYRQQEQPQQQLFYPQPPITHNNQISQSNHASAPVAGYHPY